MSFYRSLCMKKNINHALLRNLPLYITVQHVLVLTERIMLIAAYLKASVHLQWAAGVVTDMINCNTGLSD